MARRLDAALGTTLQVLREETSLLRRVDDDPVSLVRRYRAAGDQEVAGLFCASLAYGRVAAFLPVLRKLLAAMGPSPRRFCAELASPRASAPDFSPFRGLVYRFHTGADLACLAWAIGEALRAHGSLEDLFLAQTGDDGDLRAALAGFTGWLRSRDFRVVRAALGPPRALRHLLPDAASGGAQKRHLLYLRWMVRPADGVDLGAWRRVSPAHLVIPVDTHIGRMAHNLGLTRRRDLSWRTAEEITARLRTFAPDDPVRYDFTLCHFGMSGACPRERKRATCQRCILKPHCAAGRRLAR